VSKILKLLLFILIFINYSIPLFAIPTNDDTISINSEWDIRKLDQEDYKQTNGRYKQKLKVVKNGVEYETHEYLGSRGVGYIKRAIKNENDKKYLLERHVGVETDRNLSIEWTEIIEPIE